MPRLLLPAGPVQGRLLVFDKDGVLVDFHRLWGAMARARASAVASQFAAPDLVSGLLAAWGVAPDGAIDPDGVLVVGRRQDALEAARQVVRGAGRSVADIEAGVQLGFETVDRTFSRLAHTQALPGVWLTLRGLQAQGWRLALATSDHSRPSSEFLEALGVLPWFDAVVGADLVARGKPWPDLFLLACERAGIAPGEAWMVGDAPADFEMARAAGAAGGIGVLSGVSDAARLGLWTPHVLPGVFALQTNPGAHPVPSPFLEGPARHDDPFDQSHAVGDFR
ncbi:MAG: HAD family hydrolase [Candidatus Sericytochromatia bacterium]|nr:HAD family hydrolase [Candidatus Sericytochromatia bacterium]